MKLRKIILFSFFSAIITWPAARAADTGYDMQIRIEGVKDSMCYLANYFGDKQYLQDSVKADADGNIRFKGDTAWPGGIYLVVMPEKRYFEIILDKDQHFELTTKYSDPVNSMQIKGSEDNDDFYAYLRFVTLKGQKIQPLRAQHSAATNEEEKVKLAEQITQIDNEVKDYRKDYIEMKPNTLLAQLLKVTIDIDIPDPPSNPDGSIDSTFAYKYYKEHYFDNINLQDDRMVRTPVFHPKIEQYMTKLTPQVPDSIIATADHLISKLDPKSENFRYVIWWITNHYETSKYMGMDAVFVHMAKKYYTLETAYWVDETQLFKIQERAKVLEPILLGKQVRNLTLADSSKKYHALYNVMANYTVLYFWDPDCGHCKKVTPVLKTLYEKVKNDGVEVYAVCTEVEIDKWKKYIKENELEWINVADPELRNNFRYEFDITSTPQIFLLDKDKKILAKRIEVETLKQILEKEMDKEIGDIGSAGTEGDDHNDGH
jgi:thiol-disulfide isomerase/thioredoxin